MRLTTLCLTLPTLLLAGCSTAALLPCKAGPPPRPSAVRTLTPDPRSPVLARQLSRASRAQLDFAAYHKNPVTRQQVERLGYAPQQASVGLAEQLKSLLVSDSLVACRRGLPATLSEPMAFAPLTDYLVRRDAKQAAGLERLRSALREERWGLKVRPGVFLQQITTAWIHRPKGAPAELWVKVEFEPWARVFAGLGDEDGDGRQEFYGRAQPSHTSEALIARIEADYLGKTLGSAEVHAWANELASYWYPSYNTDVVKLAGQRRWPIKSVEPEVLKASANFALADPTLVIRGKPHGKPIYTVLKVPGIAPLDGKLGKTAGSSALAGFPVQSDTAKLQKQIRYELTGHGGSWSAWELLMDRNQQRLRAALERRPKKVMALQGKDGFLFFRRSLDYVLGGDIQQQPTQKNPLQAIVGFKDYLKRLGVDFLLVPVPTKAEVFPDKLPGVQLSRKKSEPLPLLHPYGRKFLLELAAAGVEVLDLLPFYLAARRAPQFKQSEPLYQPQDTHWTDLGLQLAAGEIGRRVEAYPWYATLKRAQQVTYRIRSTRFSRQGDLVSRLLPGEQRRYKPASLIGAQVFTGEGKSSKLYEDDPTSPVVVLGDSFTGVYQRTDCGSAGISAHIAHRIKHPVDLVMSYGGGPNVRNKLLQRDEKTLKKMRLVIWIFAARDFYNYWDDWEPLRK